MPSFLPGECLQLGSLIPQDEQSFSDSSLIPFPLAYSPADPSPRGVSGLPQGLPFEQGRDGALNKVTALAFVVNSREPHNLSVCTSLTVRNQACQ